MAARTEFICLKTGQSYDVQLTQYEMFVFFINLRKNIKFSRTPQYGIRHI
jgi:23S rRNA G2069 N7-methylase RlmK/C1962 C5-methylase RlmI